MADYILRQVNEEGKPCWNESSIQGSTDLNSFLELYDKLHPPKQKLWTKEVDDRRLVIDGDEGRWQLPLAPEAFYEIYRNLSRNAWNRLEAVTAESLPVLSDFSTKQSGGQDNVRQWHRIQNLLELYGSIHQRFPENVHPTPSVLSLLYRTGPYVILDVFDNGPSFRVPTHYPNGQIHEGTGLRVVESVWDALTDAGIDAAFEPVRVVSSADLDFYREKCNDPIIGMIAAGDWSVARFSIEMGE
jgi:hypothetical protein